jgi:H+/Cl- antiporter ClcA
MSTAAGPPDAAAAAPPEGAPSAGPPDPQALLRSNAYLKLLALAAIAGAPIAVVAYGFLKLVAVLQQALFHDLPTDVLGFSSPPGWWPVPVVAVGGLLVAASIRFLPGQGGHSPADGFKAGGVTVPIELPGIFCAALATLAFGSVLGPEAPLILIGSGLGALAVKLLARDAPPAATAVIAGAGSFAAISTLFGSPLPAAFLLLEAAGLGRAAVGVVLVPGLLAAGLGTLIFVGLDSLTGFGTFSLAIPNLPHFDRPTGAMFGYAIAFGLVAPVLGVAIRRLALAVRPIVERRMLLLTSIVGLLIGGLAVAFDQATGKGVSQVLFSGQDQLGPLISGAGGFSVGALLFLVLTKSLAYMLALSSFRGGPVFPSLFIGGAAGIAASHLPGLPLVPAVAMGLGAMCCTMLNLPLTSVLLATLLLSADGLAVMPLVIVAVVVSYVVTARITPPPAPGAVPPASPAGAGA